MNGEVRWNGWIQSALQALAIFLSVLGMGFAYEHERDAQTNTQIYDLQQKISNQAQSGAVRDEEIRDLRSRITDAQAHSQSVDSQLETIDNKITRVQTSLCDLLYRDRTYRCSGD